MKLSDWARKKGIPYRTAWNWVNTGKLPPGTVAQQMPTGTILITEPEENRSAGAIFVVLYARVSSSDQKHDLDGQLGRLTAYATQQGWVIVRAITEIGSGLNGRRPKLMQLLADPTINSILVEHKDRLMRFGAEYVEAALAAQQRRLVVIDPSETKDDLVQDMTDVLTSFCARLYGRRSAKNRAERAMRTITADG
jgi:putative resolvase